jgi:hypothetical protein
MEAAEEQAAAAPVAADCAMEEDASAEVATSAAAGEEDDAAALAAAEAAYSWPELSFDLPPRRLHHFADQFRAPCSPAGNFLKGVKWSPDGSSFLTSSDDNSLRLFYLCAHPSYPPYLLLTPSRGNQPNLVICLFPFPARPEDAYSADTAAEAAVGAQGAPPLLQPLFAEWLLPVFGYFFSVF